MASFGWVIQNGVLRMSNSVVVPNNTYLFGRNAANTGDVNMIKVNASNNIETGSNTIIGGNLTFANNSTGISVPATGGFLSVVSRGFFDALADAVWRFQNAAGTIGVSLKADALPTIASGFGTSPAITAGSTAMAGSVNVGTGGVATSGVINFNGTAFPSAPFVIAMNSTTGALLRATATTTQLTITANAAFTASDVVMWHCFGARA